MVKEFLDNEPRFWEFIRQLRSNPKVQHGFIEHVSISEKQQNEYMEIYNDCFHVASNGKELVGFIGAIDGDIRVCVDPKFQGKGWGKFMVTELTLRHPNLTAKVKHDNISSLSLFKSTGYNMVLEDAHFKYFKIYETGSKEIVHNPYKIVNMFEEELAKYTGAPIAVTVDSCTNALFLTLKYMQHLGFPTSTIVTVPKHTYLSVPMSVINAGFDLTFKDIQWSGAYSLNPFPIVDAAKRLTSNMYIPGKFMCLSFHIKKLLAIGKGGVILTDSEEAAKWFRKARYEGRGPVNYKDDNINSQGWNMYMTPQQAAHGLSLMQNYPLNQPDLDEKGGYRDLTEFDFFKKYKKK